MILRARARRSREKLMLKTKAVKVSPRESRVADSRYVSGQGDSEPDGSALEASRGRRTD